ncbi:MAG: DUF4124 domain-containing protein [Lautropia sp.]
MTKLLPRASLLFCLGSLALPIAAQAQIYRCESPDGTPLFQNAPGKNCKAMDLPSLTTVPSPRPPAGNRTTTANASPSDFPRVDASAQRNRDSDRRRILEDELAREKSRLEEIRKEYNGGEPERLGNERNYQKYLDRVERLKDDITRSETNVASLRRELESVK